MSLCSRWEQHNKPTSWLCPARLEDHVFCSSLIIELQVPIAIHWITWATLMGSQDFSGPTSAQPDSFHWLHKPESWSNTIFSCHWGGFKSRGTGRTRGSADGQLCLGLSLAILETRSELSKTNPPLCSEQRQWKGYATAVQISLVNQGQKSVPGNRLLWHI